VRAAWRDLEAPHPIDAMSVEAQGLMHAYVQVSSDVHARECESTAIDHVKGVTHPRNPFTIPTQHAKILV